MKKLLVLGLVVTAFGCESDYSKQRKQYLSDLAQKVIVPAINDFGQKATQLDAAAAALQASPTAETLASAQQAWRDARATWKITESFLLGKDMAAELRPHIDWWPADPVKLETNLTGAGALDSAFVGAQGSNTQGFMALEYFLFDSTAPDQVLVRLGEARRREYVKGLTTNLLAEAVAFGAEWSPADFYPQFVDAGTNEGTYESAKDAVSDVINRLAYITQKIADMKLAKPLGLTNGTAVDPTLEESPRSDSSRDDILNSLAGVEAMYTTTYANVTGYSLSELVALRSHSVDDKVKSQLALAKTAAMAIPAPFRTALTSNSTPIYDAEQKMRDLLRTFKNEVASGQGTVITFSDSDGD